MTKKHSGFVGIVGEPNVGKSTLLNALIGEKLAGVSPKPQTTREIVRGILSDKRGQAVYLDMPGLHQPKDKIGGWMMREVEKNLPEVDLIYYMARPRLPGATERRILDMLEQTKLPVILLVNQIDCFKKSEVLPILDEYQNLFPFKEFIPISAKEGLQLDIVVEKTFEHLPEGDPLFPEDQISDQNERFLVCELIREKLYIHTKKEVPYSTFIQIDKFSQRNDKLIDIEATVVVERESQKAIVVGAKGQTMKLIGSEARKDIENLLGCKVFLKLWAKAEQNWKDNRHMLRKFGYS